MSGDDVLDAGTPAGSGARSWSLIAHATSEPFGFVPEPGSGRRAWIDATPNKFARRCLPLTIAGQAGWEIRTPFAVRARWNGGDELGNVEIRVLDPTHPARSWVSDHFGAGIVTFAIPYVFRTPPGVELLVRGAPNFWIAGAHPLEGLVETDWATSTFTMNWRIVEPGRWVVWQAGDPICFLQPVSVATLEAAEPVLAPIGGRPDVEQAFRAWAASRDAFNADAGRDPKKWQKHYYQGRGVGGETAPSHRTRVSLAGFAGAAQDGDGRPLAERLASSDIRFRKAAGLQTAERGDGFVLTDSEGAEHRLNHSAVFILECCTGDARAADIAAELRAAYGLSETPLQLVGQCLSELLAAGLISD
jgi:hypothetical protein